MLSLALETSTSHGSLALFEGDRLLGERGFQALRGHNSKIYGPLGELLECLEGRRLDRVVVGTGPGSYTGVRIAISIADALALSHGAGMIGKCSFVAAGGVEDQDRYWVVGDARRKSWYRGEIDGGNLVREVTVETRDAWETAVERALGEGTKVVTFDEEPPFPGVVFDRPTAVRLGKVTLGSSPGEAPVEPLYLAAPYITKAKTKTRHAAPTGAETRSSHRGLR